MVESNLQEELPMSPEFCDALSFVQSLTPTWCKTQQVMLAELLRALQERPALCLSDIARALPPGPGANEEQSLHGRLKRTERFLSNPRLDEVAILVRWFHLTLRFGGDPGAWVGESPILPMLLDTTYFEPFAALIVSVPCGSRGLPIALTTYQRYTLEACFPPSTTWPSYGTSICPPAARRGQRVVPASSVAKVYCSQNAIEEQLLDYVWSFLTPGLRAVVVADRGFARASLFERLQGQQRDFVIRFNDDTWLYLPEGPGGATKEVLSLRPGESRWLPVAYYGKDERLPVAVLAIWDANQTEPWYLATTLSEPQTTETLYRWRMRIECANRDEKSGVILRESGDQHRLTATLHLHRLLLVILCAHWLAALVGLQAYHDLPAAEAGTLDLPSSTALEHAKPNAHAWDLLDQGPAQPPSIIPHRGPPPKLPSWVRRFAARGHLSYVRLGMEILRTQDLVHLVRRAVRWLGLYLWRLSPLWRPWQIRYRLRHWWPLPT
jgi:hypothetical protein